MKAEDTVMTLRQQAEVWLKVEQDAGWLKDCDVEGALTDQNLFDALEQPHSQAVALAQAKISFRAGIKEAVEWILNGESETHNVPEAGGMCLCIYLRAWQAKLKEWGIEDEGEKKQ